MNKNLIYLADDHIVLRNGLALLINDFDNCEVVGKGANGQDLLNDLEKGLSPTLLILDLNMPVMDGYETAAWLKKNRPEIRILVLSMFDSEIAIIRLMQVGVRGMLKKDSSPEILEEAIRSIASAGFYFGMNGIDNLVNFFEKDENNRSASDLGPLSDEDITYIKLSATEMTYKEMGASLKLSPNGLETMRKHLFEKLGVKSRVGLVIYAVRKGLISF